MPASESQSSLVRSMSSCSTFLLAPLMVAVVSTAALRAIVLVMFNALVVSPCNISNQVGSSIESAAFCFQAGVPGP